jgi:hypothetical protein
MHHLIQPKLLFFILLFIIEYITFIILVSNYNLELNFFIFIIILIINFKIQYLVYVVLDLLYDL